MSAKILGSGTIEAATVRSAASVPLTDSAWTAAVANSPAARAPRNFAFVSIFRPFIDRAFGRLDITHRVTSKIDAKFIRHSKSDSCNGLRNSLPVQSVGL